MKLSKTMIGATGLALMLGMMMTPMDSNAKGRGMGNGGGQQNGLSTIISNMPMQDLSSLEEIGLTKMREEEKLARDVYQALHDKWGHRVFLNIAQSEQQHMNAIHALLKKYSMEDPAATAPAGVFNDQELQNLYNSLVEQGEKSLVEAFQVGATIEDLDIKDLYDFLEQTNNTDIKIVYQNLAKGSRNHLRSFYYQLSLNGVNYEAQFLTTTQINDIISSPKERGRVDENGEQVTGNKNTGKKNGRRAGMAGNGNGSGNGNGRGGQRFGDGTGNGSGTGDCQSAVIFRVDNDLLARGGNGGGGNGGGGNGAGDGNGNNGSGPQDGSGKGLRTGDCVNV